MTDQLTTVLRAAGAEPITPGGHVWDLHERGCLASMVGMRSTLTPEIRRRILDVVIASPLHVLLYAGEDPTTDSAGVWSSVSPGVWRMDERRDAEVLLGSDAMQSGNWVLLVSDLPGPQPVQDLIRATEARVLDFMRENQVHALVDSFHDDVQWRVAVAP